MKLYRILVFLVLCMSFWTVCLNAQSPVFRQLTEEEGLASMTVYRILQDTKGYIWMATQNGLCRYNGREFEYYSHPQQKNNEIIDMKADKYGRIWFINLSGQIFYCAQNRVHFFYEHDLAKDMSLSSFALDDLFLYLTYVANDRPFKTEVLSFELAELDSTKNQQIVFDKKSILTIFITDQTQAFIFFKNKPHQNIAYSQDLKQEELNGAYVFEHRTFTGHAALQLSSDEILVYERSNHRFYTIKKHQKQKNYTLSKRLRSVKLVDGRMVFLTDTGLIITQTLDQLPSADVYFENYMLNDYFKDQEGNVWIATDGDGVLVVPSFSFLKVDELAASTVHCLNDHETTVYLGQDVQQISALDQATKKIIKQQTIEQVGGRVTSIVHHPQRGMIIGADRGLYAEDEALNAFLKQHPYRGIARSIKCLLLSSDNKLWVGSGGLVFYFDLDALDGSQAMLDVLKKRTYGLAEDDKGNIWIGTTTGLYYYSKDGKLTLFDAQQYGIEQELIVSDIASSEDASIWVTTNNVGLLQIKNQQLLNHYSQETVELMKTNDFRAVFVDEKQDLWLSSAKGIYTLDVSETRWQSIDKYDGLGSDDVLALSVVDTMLWVSTANGLLTFPKSALNTKTLAPAVYINAFKINAQDTSLMAHYALDYKQNTVRIDFEGLCFKNAKALSYEYRLLGLGQEWSVATDTYVPYHELNPGAYNFQVRAIDASGLKSNKVAELSFVIAPPWWQRWWFKTSFLIVVLALIYFLFKRRIKRLKQEQRYQNKINEVRMLALQSQMNPHFIFNALNAIQFFLGAKDEEHAMIYLARFAQLIRLSFEYSKKRLITLEDEIEFLKLYLSLEALRFSNTTAVSWDVSAEVKANLYTYKVPPLLIQPVIENAFKHGLFHKKGSKKLLVKLERKGQFLSCTIQDNGVGREKVAQINQWKTAKHQSLGLKTTQERLQLLNDTHVDKTTEQPYLEIEDLVDENGQAQGTRVELLFKLQSDFAS